MLLIAFYLVLSALAVDCIQDTNTRNCAQGKCEVISGSEICTDCKDAGNVPIDGVCTPRDSAGTKCKKDGGAELDGSEKSCGQCTAGYFLYKGGCYTIGGDVGRLVCADAASKTPGVCESCIAGYFKNPSAASNKDSCIACNDVTGVEDKKGLEGCETCDPPSSDVAICKTCLEGFFGTNLGNVGGTCTACSASCAACTGGANDCTKCDAGGATPYLKKADPSDPTGTCVSKADCTKDGGYYADDTTSPDAKECKKCDATCADCSSGLATACTKCDAGGATPYLKKADPSDPTGTCVSKADCTKDGGYYADDTTSPDAKECKKCDATCADCSSGLATACTKCDAGGATPYLKKADPSDPTGTCVSILGCAYDNGHYADDGTKECKVCNDGKRPDTAGTKCFSCPDKNCERCDRDNVCAKCNTGEPPTDGACPVAERGCHPSCGECTSDAMTNQADKCTSCKGDNYLRVIVSGSGICIPASICASDKSYFAKEVVESTGSKKMCLSCSDATHGIADCKKCSSEASSAQTKLVLVCSNCDTKWLSPLGNACLEKCPAGTYSNRSADNINVCASCHSTCAECDGNAEATSCRACYPGSVLSKGSNGATGACIPECTGKYAENCEAGQCTAVVGGSRYCSRCRAGFAPVDGVCVSATARAPTGCTPGNGVCTSCTATYFLESGGCYNARAFPGSTLCTTASDGKCTNCANGQEKDAQGSCPACPDGCSKCATSGSPKACSECLPGYYKSGNSCIKCDANDSQITGVANCVSCAPPTGGSGPVICYVTKDGGSGGDSTNKSGGLSTGAIAGIAVAVVIVVGGLVGFLCWWFICRGRA